MALEPGRLVLARFELVAPLPRQGELRRFLARDQVTGVEVEVLSPTGTASLRPGARERWRAAWDRSTEHASLVPVVALGEHDGRPVAVRPRVSLLPTELRLSPQETGALIESMLPDVTDAADMLGGHLDRHDLVVDGEGHVRLCPGGVVPEDSLARPDRYSPARSGGFVADARFGLGVLAFELLTGGLSAQGRTAAQLSRAQERPRSPADLGVEVPAELDQALARLLSLETTTRLSVELGEGASLLALDPSRLEPAQPLPSPAGTSPHPIQRQADDPRPPGGTLDLALPRWVVVVEPHETSQAARRRLAALAGLDEQALEEAAMRSERVAVAGGPDEASAQARALALAPAGASLSIERGEAAWMRPALTLVVGLALAAGVASLGVLGIFSVLLPIFTTLAALLLAGVAVGAAGLAGAAERRRVEPLQRHWGPLQVGHRAEDDAARLLKDTRRRVLASELSIPEQRDLIDVVDELEERHAGGGLSLEELRAGLEQLHSATSRPAIDQELDPAPQSIGQSKPLGDLG